MGDSFTSPAIGPCSATAASPGWKDTIILHRGGQLFDRSYIAGHVGFIFGGVYGVGFQTLRLVVAAIALPMMRTQ